MSGHERQDPLPQNFIDCRTGSEKRAWIQRERARLRGQTEQIRRETEAENQRRREQRPEEEKAREAMSFGEDSRSINSLKNATTGGSPGGHSIRDRLNRLIKQVLPSSVTEELKRGPLPPATVEAFEVVERQNRESSRAYELVADRPQHR